MLQVSFKIVNKSQSCRVYKGVPLARLSPLNFPQATCLLSCACSTTVYYFVVLQHMPHATPQRHRAPRLTPLARQTRDDLAHLGYGPEQYTHGFLALLDNLVKEAARELGFDLLLDPPVGGEVRDIGRAYAAGEDSDDATIPGRDNGPGVARFGKLVAGLVVG